MRQTAFTILLLFGLWLGTGETASAATYYVCYNGTECNAGPGNGWSSGSDGNSGVSRSAPKRCPGAALSAASAGDVIILGDGTYSHARCGSGTSVINTRGKDGAPGNYIVMRAENRHGAIIDGGDSGTRQEDFSKYIILLDGSEYLEFDGLVVRNGTAAYWANGVKPGTRTNYIIIRNNKIHDCGFSCIFTQSPHHDWLIENNEIYNVYDQASYSASHKCGHNHGIYMNGYNMTMQNNVLYNGYGGTLITLGGHCALTNTVPSDFSFSYKVVNNTIDALRCEQWSGTIGPANDYKVSGMDFWHRGPTRCPQRDANAGRYPFNFANVTIENNLFLNGQNGVNGRDLNGETMQWIGNTNGGVTITDPACKHFPWHDPNCENKGSASGSLIGSAGYLRVNNNVTETKVALNARYQNWSDQYRDNCDNCPGINVESENGNEYRPTAASTSLLGKGSAGNAPAYDIDGNPRNLNGGVDVGAYELQFGTIPSPPTNVAIQ